ncbi:MAG: hypothetical protein IRY99_09780, partial [Isosphaeraceae bacterium]|nr:hypothetical protein [Isosphaeraceae bacterium]
ARTALVHSPDDPAAYIILSQAYQALIQQESAILDQGTSALSYSRLRFMQRAAALNYAIQTTPPPATSEGKQALAQLHLELAHFFEAAGYLDLTRDHLRAAQRLGWPWPPGKDFPTEQVAALTAELERLEDQVERVQNLLRDLETEQQASPVQLAEEASRRGMPGLAIARLEDAEKLGVSPNQVKWRLVDLYCQTGQPDRSFDVVNLSNTEDPALLTGPGTAFQRQGLISFLIGDYDNAALLWERAIFQIRMAQALESLQAARQLLAGQPRASAEQFQGLPNLVSLEASWEADLGFCLLESGHPQAAGEHFTRALTLVPQLSIRPLLAYYLQRLGRPVPEAPEAPAPPVAPSSSSVPSDASARPSAPLPKDPAELFAPPG